MHRARFIALMPLLSLLLMALLVRVVNLALREPDSFQPTLIAPVPVTARSGDHATIRLQKELKTVLLHYRTLQGDAKKQASYPQAWERWKTTGDGPVFNRRLARFVTWPDFSVGTIEHRSSGFITVQLSYDGECLKAWLIHTREGWKVAGLVNPSS